MSLLTHFKKTILNFFDENLLSGKSVLIAVSGGADSIALLHILKYLKLENVISQIGVAHVNHGLRGEESDLDELFVQECARILEIPYYTKRLTGKNSNDTGIEEWARKERYSFLLSMRDQHGYDCVATGHTSDDQAETVLMRLMRGTGLKGMRGIIPVRADNVIRPMLTIRRAELVAWLASESIPFRQDSSNKDIIYKRNWTRHRVVPCMKEREPLAVEHFTQVASEAQRIWKIVLKEINKWIECYVIAQESVFFVKKSGCDDWDIASESLCVLFERFGIKFDRHHIESVQEICTRTSGEFLLSGGWKVYPSREMLLFTCESSRSLFEYNLKIPGEIVCEEEHLFLKVEKSESGDSSDNPMKARVSLNTNEQLVYRNWTSNDRFQPLGSKIVMKVKDFLAGQGIPKAHRERIGVIATVDGEIVWIPGVRVSEQYKVKMGGKNNFVISCDRFL